MNFPNDLPGGGSGSNEYLVRMVYDVPNQFDEITAAGTVRFITLIGTLFLFCKG